MAGPIKTFKTAHRAVHKQIFAITLVIVFAGGCIGAVPAKAQSSDEIDTLNHQVEQLYNEAEYAQAAALAERTLRASEQTLGKDGPSTLTSAYNLASVYQRQGRYREAEALYRRALDARERILGKDHPDTLTTVNQLASLYKAQGHYHEAETFYKRALEARERTLGKDHPDTLDSVSGLAVLYSDQGNYTEAEALHRRALDTRERTLGKDHPDTLSSVNNLAALYEVEGRYGEAEPLYQRCLQARERILGPQHPNTLSCLNNLAVIYTRQGRYDEAEPLYKRALEARERLFGPNHPSVLSSVNNLASFYGLQGRYSEAEPLYRRVLAAQERVLGAEHPDTLLTVNNLAAVYADQHRYDEAEPLYRRALEAQERLLGKDHISTIISITNLARLYRNQERYSEAEPLFRRSVETSERVLGREHPLTLACLTDLAVLYSKQGLYSQAEPLFQRVLVVRERGLGRDHPDTLASINNLASLYFSQGDWNRAAEFWRRSTGRLAQHTLHGALGGGAALTGQKKSEALQKARQFVGLIKALERLGADASKPSLKTSRETFQTAQWALGSEAAASLAEMAARGASHNTMLEALARERQDLVAEWQKRDALRNAALGRAPDRRDAKAAADNLARTAAIAARVAKIDKQLAVQFPDYAALASAQPLSVEETQAQLAENEALVLFIDSDDKFKPAPEESFIWVVTRTQVRWVRSELGTAALTREVQALRCGLDSAAWSDGHCFKLVGQRGPRAPLPFDLARSHRLYEALFGKVEDLIKGKNLLLVLSGPLTQLPFQVLVTEPAASTDYRSAAWLVRSHALTVLPAVSSLKALRRISRPSAAKKPFIGFGNPLLAGLDAADLPMRSSRVTGKAAPAPLPSGSRR